MKNYFLLLFYLSLFVTPAGSQEIFSWSKSTGYCNPSVIGLPRAKAFIMKYEVLPHITIKSDGRQGSFGADNAVITSNRRVDFRLRFPIINKSSLTIAAGIKYTHEEFRFKTSDLNNNYSFYHDLEDRPLKSIGLHLYVVKPTKSDKYFILRASLDLNGDYESEKFGKKDFLKFSIIPLIGWKKNDNLSYAAGLSYGYTFGVPLLIPVLSINKNFNCNLGIESILPINIRLRYSKNEKNYLYTGFELAGASYRLENRDSMFSAFNKLHLFRSELRYTINYEKAIHDWLWASAEIGWRHHLRFNLTNGPRARSDIVIHNKLSDAVILSLGIFVVPPKGLLKKNK